jgi:hypothetical protein
LTPIVPFRPITFNLAAGLVVPMPTWPPLWKRAELPSVVLPVHLGMKLVVPLPVTWAVGRTGVASTANIIIAVMHVNVLDFTVASSM